MMKNEEWRGFLFCQFVRHTLHPLKWERDKNQLNKRTKVQFANNVQTIYKFNEGDDDVDDVL